MAEGFKEAPSLLPEKRQLVTPKLPITFVTPQFRTLSEPRNKLKFVVPAAVTLVLIAVILWFRYWPSDLKNGISKYRSCQYAAAAAVEFQEAVRENPELVTRWLYLGASYAKQVRGDVKTDKNQQLARKTSEAFKGALQIDPKNKVALAGMSYILRGEGDGETALAYEREFNEVEPGNIFHAVVLAGLDSQVCEERIWQFVSKFGWSNLYNGYARLMETGRKDLAKKLEDQNDGPLLDEGIKALSRAIQSKPNDPEIMRGLFQLYQLRAILERDSGARSSDLKACGEWYSKAVTARRAGERSVMDPLTELPGSSATGQDDFSFLIGFPQSSSCLDNPSVAPAFSSPSLPPPPPSS